jgi:hypothetical protein
MLFLVGLRLLQCVGWTREIRTGILPIPVQKKSIEGARQVVMMGDVAFGGRREVVLVKPPTE